MKTVRLFTLCLIALLSFQCSDNKVSVIDNLSSSSNGLNKVENIQQLCINNSFYGLYDNIGPTVSLLCTGKPEQYIQKEIGDQLWANLVTVPGDKLYQKACSNFIVGIPPVNNFQNITIGNNPKFQWDFLWSHFFTVERKIGSGSWITISSQIMNNNSGNNYTYQDNTVNLSVQHEAISYRVNNYIFNDYTHSSIYEFPSTILLNVNINGPNNILNPMKGQPPLTVTWNANITGGTDPFTYKWYYNGSLASQNSSLSRTYSYAPGQSDRYFTLKLVITDANTISRDSTLEVFLDYPPYQP